MLKKIISIKNVGRFLSCGAPGDVELKPYTLMFAENGRGKTTLCAILRSLQSGNNGHVLGRTTLGAKGGPEIRILLDSGTSTFKDGVWNATVPNLSIFDSTFVSENVYSGDAVELGHKRNLYRVIVGRQGVELARLIEQYDAASREKSADIRLKYAAVQALVPQGLTVETFLALQEDTAIDAKIAEKTKEFKSVRQADLIRSRGGLSELTFPSFPSGFSTLLGKTIVEIAKDAERFINNHIETHAMQERGEPWLSEGLGYIRNDRCPFCGQSLDGVKLVAAYRAYFSKAYNDLVAEITALRQLIATTFGDRAIAQMERVLDQNSSGVEFWSRYCPIATPVLTGASEIGDTLRSIRQAALALLDRKAATPLDRVATNTLFTTAHAAFVAAQNNLTTYNQAVQNANTTINKKKADTSISNIKSVETLLIRLQATKRRHEPDSKKVCQEYQDALTEKGGIENRKARVKDRLDKHTQQVIGSYQKTINRLLEDFQAGFRITEAKHGYPGGVASSTYQILINDTPVELGDASSPIERPSFKNTLSSGDKSTLALAFFLAQLEHDPEKANQIVVFDDPFNSQDSFRKECTVQEIKKYGDTCQQVIVLSHDQNFLKRIWDRLATKAADRKCLYLTRIGVRDTRICAWDIEEATQAPCLLDRKALTDYYRTPEGNPRDIVNKIRPVLETYCRNLYPGEFGQDTLGTIVGKIRTSGTIHQLFPILGDLDTLNEYTRRYHHGESPNAGTEPINDTELQGFVKKTLMITGLC